MTQSPWSLRLSAILLSIAVLAVSSLFVSCGGGRGGGGSTFTITNSIFGWDPLSGDFNSKGNAGEAPSMPKNMSVVLEFSDNIDTSTVSTESIIVQSFDPMSGSPGPLAAVVFEARGSRLIVSPLITFSNSNVVIGFEDDTTYRIAFAQSPENSVVRSRRGRAIDARAGPFFFFTTSQVFDRNPGPPVPVIEIVDAGTGEVLVDDSTEDPFLPQSPVPGVVISFDEGVRPDTVVRGDTGTSDTIRFDIDIDGDPETASSGDRVPIAGLFSFTSNVESARLTFAPLLRSLPTRPTTGALYVVSVEGTVQDLAGNFLDERTELFFRTEPGPSVTPADPIIEAFDDTTFADVDVSSVSWSTRQEGFLTPGVGGGRGGDGPFEPDDASFKERWDADDGFGGDLNPEINVDETEQIVTMNTGELGDRRVFEFTRFDVPFGWTVVGTGDNQLEILSTGDVNISGVVSVAGEAGEVFNANGVDPGLSGNGSAGGADGGLGGSVTDGVADIDGDFGGDLFESGPAGYKDPNADSQGISGNSETIGTLSLLDAERDFSLILNLSDLFIQPNIGIDDFRFEVIHPTFKVNGLGVDDNTVTAVGSSDPEYQGNFTDPSENPWLDPGDFLPAPIAEDGDPYLIGALNGFEGSDSSLYGAGSSSRSQTVSQTFITLGRSGGGGGGGSASSGSAGMDDPTLDVDYDDPGYGGSGTNGGAGGNGRIESQSTAVAARTLSDTGRFAGLNLVGHILNPRVGQNLVFEIESNTANRVTIIPVTTLDGEIIDLTAVPGLDPGDDYWIAASWSTGGAGGGGSGIHCAGSVKSSTPFNLPNWSPGSGGGSGGGAVHIETAGAIEIGSSGSITAAGGDGGRSTGGLSTGSSGGGGGGGGVVWLKSGDAIRVVAPGLISAAGGDGGAAGVVGGDGGDGRIRLENFDDDLTVSAFSGVSDPPITTEDLGRFVGGSESFGQSLHYSSGVLVPLYTSLVVRYTYRAVTNPNVVLNGVWTVNPDGSVDGESTLSPSPFLLSVAGVEGNANNGLLDTPPPASIFFDPTVATVVGDEDGVLSDLDGLPYIRFQIVLPRTFTGGGLTVTDIRIDSVSFELNQTVPSSS